jgi:single-stranded-DNA-specific exonuclease
MDGLLTQWKTHAPDPAVSARLNAELGLPMPVCRVLATRGIGSASAARDFLNPRLSTLSDPFLLGGMDRAVDRLWKAIHARESIVVFGDYDADGVTATALVMMVLGRLGGRVSYFLPHRARDGYGLSLGALRRCLDLRMPELLVTVDCGTGSRDAVRLATESGVDVIVTDHHESDGTLAEPVALLNPKLGCPPSMLPLAGVGVAFKLCHALVKSGLDRGEPACSELDLRDWLDLVALGTIADVVPLLGDNRPLVRHGLLRMRASGSVGLNALMKQTMKDCNVTPHHIGFVLGPRLNAAGRMASADEALEMLISTDVDMAARLAQELDKRNGERQKVEAGLREEAEKEITRLLAAGLRHGLVAGRTGWHVGTIGIVASRLCDQYSRPVVLVSFNEEGVGRGSCRSPDGVDLTRVLEECRPVVVAAGGHRSAAGVTVRKENFDAFCERFESGCRSQMKDGLTRPVTWVDDWISLREGENGLVPAMQHLEPTGEGNAKPVWGTRGVRVMGAPRVVGKNHLKFRVGDEGMDREAIAFGMGNQARTITEGTTLDVVYNLEENLYYGGRSLQLTVRDFRPS